MVLTLTAELAVQLPAMLGEGSIWDSRSQRLLWLDIYGCKLYRFDPTSQLNEEFDLSKSSASVSSVVPLSRELDPDGDSVAITLREGFAIYSFRTRSLERLGNDPPMGEFERFNDGKVDPRGCYWAGTITRDKDFNICKGATLYCRDIAGKVSPILTDLSISNGLAWTKDGGTMYYIDTASAQVDAFDFNMQTGVISNRRAAIKGFDFHTTGFPDGCAIDQQDRLWIARFNGGCVGCYDPRSGSLLAEVRVPPEAGKQVTSVAFGGKSLDDLYITTAREGFGSDDDKRFPLAGSLFVVRKAQLAEIGSVAGQPPHELKLSKL